MLKLGVIGYGVRIQHVVREIECFGTAELHAIADPRAGELQARLEAEGRQVAFYRDADDLLQNAALDGVLIGTRCSLHAAMAVKVARRGVPLFLEKPVATSYDDLAWLQSTWAAHPVPVVVSFPLRVTPLLQRVREIVASGLIGTVEHVQAVNNVPYGDVYYAGWYRDHREIGNLFLQKATHDLDYLFSLVGQRPRWISAMKAQRVYGGQKPAGLRCMDCQEQETCMESPLNLYRRRYASAGPADADRLCLFGAEVQHEDTASALVEFENGAHLAYSQNFFARNSAAARGARLLGYKGTVEFDWYRREVVVHMHHSPRSERITFDAGINEGSHWGGDRQLAFNFLQVMAGQAPPATPLEAGILSALACMKANEAAETRRVLEIRLPDP